MQQRRNLILIAAGLVALAAAWLGLRSRKSKPHQPDAPPTETPADSEYLPPKDASPAQTRSTGARYSVFLLVVMLSALLLITLPGEVSGPFFTLILFVGAVGGVIRLLGGESRRWIWSRLRGWMRLWWSVRAPKHLMTTHQPLALRQVVMEIGVLLVAALLVTTPLRYSSDTLRLPGGEMEWLTGSATLAYQGIQSGHGIPLWQPYYEIGEPEVGSPFAFVLNPVSTLPSLIFGPVQGLKISVVLYAMVAATGGWFLGRMLGLGAAGRVLLGLLLLGKGNMHGAIFSGYFQLGVSQAYFPWVIGATLGVLRLKSRWPLVLLAISLTLMFWAGNIWYMLPTLFAVGLLTFTHTFGLHPDEIINSSAVRRMVAAGFLTIGLSAATLLPIWQNRAFIGGHPPEVFAGHEVDATQVIPVFFRPEQKYVLNLDVLLPDTGHLQRGEMHFYYSYVAPEAFVLLILLIFPPIYPLLHRPPVAQWGRIWWVGLIMIVLTFAWGVGGTGLFRWLYATFDELKEWRFVGRALAVTSFWIGVLVAMRYDALLRALMAGDLKEWLPGGIRLRQGLALLLVGASLFAGFDVVRQWRIRPQFHVVDTPLANCLRMLNEQHPDDFLTVHRHGYDQISAFITTETRLRRIEADYFPLSVPRTLGHFALQPDINNMFLAEYVTPSKDEEAAWLLEEGFVPVEGVPVNPSGVSCIYEKPENHLHYAFTLPLDELIAQQLPANLLPLIQPVAGYVHEIDTIGVLARASSEGSLVVIVQELAYPGWQVLVDGQQRRIESVGADRLGFIGVTLPPDGALHQIEFRYRPPLLYAGMQVTLLTALLCALYLLHITRYRKRLFTRNR